jgi:hypothetical protein
MSKACQYSTMDENLCRISKMHYVANENRERMLRMEKDMY